MDVTRLAVERKGAVGIVVLVLMLLCSYCFFNLPVQLIPDRESLSITVRTAWRASSPSEIEAHIIEPQERAMRGLPGLKRYSSNAFNGVSFVNLEFEAGTDLQSAFIEVVNRLNQADSLPSDAAAPEVISGAFYDVNKVLSTYFVRTLPDNPKHIDEYIPFVFDTLVPLLTKVPGVKGLGNQIQQDQWREQLYINIDPVKLAQTHVTLPDVIQRMRGSDDITGGYVELGKRQYLFRYHGRFDARELTSLVLDWRDGRTIRLGDVAKIERALPDPTQLQVLNGTSAFYLPLERQESANAFETMKRLTAHVDELNQNVLLKHGLVMEPSLDPSLYIERSINFVSSNLLFGISLALAVMWSFLRQWRSTLLVAISIPLSLMASFGALYFLGHTINLISLAGIAFASGMVVDAGIVVKENIFRLKRSGLSNLDASVKGATEVAKALLASTVTTIIVFLPVLFMEGAVGQIFGDLAITISVSILVSLFTATIIIPALMDLWPSPADSTETTSNIWGRLSSLSLLLSDTPGRRLTVLLVMLLGPLILCASLLPKVDYLPTMNRDGLYASFSLPFNADLNYIEKEMVAPIVARMEPYIDGSKSPHLINYSINARSDSLLFAARPKSRDDVEHLKQVLSEEVFVDIPGLDPKPRQRSVFAGIGGGRMISLHVNSDNKNVLRDVSSRATELIDEHIDGAYISKEPDFSRRFSEISVAPRDVALAQVGWGRRELAQAVRVIGDGLFIGNYFAHGDNVRMILKAEEWADERELESVPLHTPQGGLVSLGELAEVGEGEVETSIHHYLGARAASLSIFLPDDVTITEAKSILINKVEPEISQLLDSNGYISYGGNSSDLDKTLKAIGWNFTFAFTVLFLLLCGMFRSIRDSLLVIMTVPLAAVGGALALNIMNLFFYQSLDMLTAIGFLILLGLVVNNAILLVSQTNQALNQGLSIRDAIESALLLRTRPIFMTTLTSVFGMLPLVLIPGDGSEVYRGMAAVIVGGMTVSCLFSLVLLPTLLRVYREQKPKSVEYAQCATEV